MGHGPWGVEVRRFIVEYLFGAVKRVFNEGYLLLNGLGKVAGRLVLLACV
jgi:hypothetical protein